MIRQMVRFGLSGVVVTLFDAGLLWVFVTGLGVGLAIGNVCAFVGSSLLGYFLNMRYVFRDSRFTSRMASLAVFTGLSGVGLVLNELVVLGAARLFGGVYYMVAKLIATGVTMVYNFISRKLVYERREKDDI